MNSPSSLLLMLNMVTAIWTIFAPGTLPTLFGAAAVLAFFAYEWRALARVGRILVCLCLILPVFLAFRHGLQLSVITAAIDRAVFLAFFVTSLSFLQSAARSSPLIRRCGEAVVNQPPGRRYTVLTIGGALFGVLLNLGTISLLGTMIREGVDAGRQKTEDRVSEIRLQRMTLAMLRGFCSIPMWSPITVTLAIILASLPDITYFDILPVGVTLTVIYLASGWVIDRLTYPRPAAANVVKGAPLITLLPLVGLVVLIPTVAFVSAQLLTISMISALLIALPFMAAVWIFFQSQGQENRLKHVGKRLWTDTLPSLPQMRSEIAIFAGSGFLGVMVVPLVDTAWLGAMVTGLGLHEGWVLTLTFWAIAVCSAIGINPIISVTLAVEVLPRLDGLQISPLSVAVMAVSAWAVIVNFSPFSAAVRIGGRIIDRDPMHIGMRWNAVFAVTMIIMLSLGLLFFG